MQSAYRFEPALKGRSDAFMQAGVELIGSDSYMADLEMVSMAITVLQECNETNFSVELGDAGIFKELMRELHASPSTKEEIRYLIETKNYSALNDLLDTLGDNRIIHALKKLPSLFGGEEVFDKMEQLYTTPHIQDMLQYLRKLYNEIAELIGKERLSVDLGIVNKADYYTGVIIKGYLEGYGEEVLSGGRYNKLLASFGYDVPAVGFAVNVDAVTKLAAKKNPREKKPADAVIYAEDGYEKKAILLAESMRRNGAVVEFALEDTAEAALQYAKTRNVPKLYRVEEEVTEVTVL
jgi:ATP phosphoribosyltransferase regulatory subunit